MAVCSGSGSGSRRRTGRPPTLLGKRCRSNVDGSASSTKPRSHYRCKCHSKNVKRSRQHQGLHCPACTHMNQTFQSHHSSVFAAPAPHLCRFLHPTCRPIGKSAITKLSNRRSSSQSSKWGFERHRCRAIVRTGNGLWGRWYACWMQQAASSRSLSTNSVCCFAIFCGTHILLSEGAGGGR